MCPPLLCFVIEWKKHEYSNNNYNYNNEQYNLNEFHFSSFAAELPKNHTYFSHSHSLYIFITFIFHTSFLYNYHNIIIIIRVLNAFVQKLFALVSVAFQIIVVWILPLTLALSHTHSPSDFLFFNWILHEIWLSYCNVSALLFIVAYTTVQCCKHTVAVKKNSKIPLT